MPQDPTRYADFTLSQFTEALASPAPVPGGGSASAVAASIAAGLVVMVARLSLDRPKYAAYTATHERAIAAGEVARTRFLELADADARAFAVYAAAMKLPRDTDEERSARAAAMDAAAQGAAAVPLDMVRECRSLINHAESLARRSNLNAYSDLAVAALLLDAAARGAGANVLINVESIADQEAGGALIALVQLHLGQISEVASQVHAEVQNRDLREPEAA